MCLRKRRIKNRSKDENLLSITRPNIDIPCGHCSECRKAKTNDWLVRSYFEYTSKDQKAYFVTFDFDDANLPLYNTISKSPCNSQDRAAYLSSVLSGSPVPGYLYPCFDAELMTKFFERLRARKDFPKFRYFLSGDRGDALDRPHIHAVFIFDKDAIDDVTFFSNINDAWYYGSHTNIQSISNYYKNVFRAFEYVCKYTTKQIDKSKLEIEKLLPQRFQCRTYSSVGFGCQALDPSEFNSERLLKEGLSFRKIPGITIDMMKQGNLVYLPIRNNGQLVPFKIPRYYELKLFYNSHWNSLEKKCELHLNEDGIELSRLRHNRQYVYFFNKFECSDYNINLSPLVYTVFARFYPNSPYNGLSWSDICHDVLHDRESFLEFCKIRDYFIYCDDSFPLSRYRPKRFSVPSYQFNDDVFTPDSYIYQVASCSEDLKSLFCNVVPSSTLERYIEACFLYDCHNYYDSLDKYHYSLFKDIEDKKKKILKKCSVNPQYKAYLRRKKFKFSSLNPSNYVSFLKQFPDSGY